MLILGVAEGRWLFVAFAIHELCASVVVGVSVRGLRCLAPSLFRWGEFVSSSITIPMIQYQSQGHSKDLLETPVLGRIGLRWCLFLVQAVAAAVAAVVGNLRRGALPIVSQRVAAPFRAEFAAGSRRRPLGIALVLRRIVWFAPRRSAAAAHGPTLLRRR